MSQVRMRHSDVEGEITVAEESVPFHAASGWEVIEDEPPGGADDNRTDGGEPDGEKTKSERPRASAAKKKES